MTAIVICVLAALLMAVQPVSAVLYGATLPIPNKGQMALNLLGAGVRGMSVFLLGLTAPVVVPVALLFTKWEADKLPALFRWYDNDVSINGDVRKPNVWDLADVPFEDTPAARSMCYWAEGKHPRSFYARYVWLGLRNRCSKLSQALGYTYTRTEEFKVYGDPFTGRDHEGWVVTECAGMYRLYAVQRLGKVCFRLHYGYKVNVNDVRLVAPVVAIAASLISWQG